MKDRQTIQWPKEKVKTDKQWSTKHYTEPHNKLGINLGAPEGLAVPAPLVTSVTSVKFSLEMASQRHLSFYFQLYNPRYDINCIVYKNPLFIENGTVCRTKNNDISVDFNVTNSII